MQSAPGVCLGIRRPAKEVSSKTKVEWIKDKRPVVRSERWCVFVGPSKDAGFHWVRWEACWVKNDGEWQIPRLNEVSTTYVTGNFKSIRQEHSYGERSLCAYQNCLWKVKVPPSLYKTWKLHLESIQFPHCFQLNLDFLTWLSPRVHNREGQKGLSKHILK